MIRSFLFLMISVIFFSCATTKNTTYVRDIPDSMQAPIDRNMASFTEPLIQSNDLLLISIQTLDPQSGNAITGSNNTGIFAAQAASGNGQGTSNIPGYLVDKNGNIELPLVGKIKVSGLNTTDAKELIRKQASVFYKTPVVNVRFANFNISVLGEVSKPAQYTVPTERVTLLDALAMAGDMTIYGKRNNVLLIREEGGTKKYVRFDLTNSDFMKSPYFYLKQNDVIYVEPTKSKVAMSNYVRDRNTGYAISIITSLASLIAIIATRIR
ncbi:MAG: polysaccharide biosynthesis/export family protein [Bacteroidetes bacterium]|nr:polysaccharide biosynthesis/export family protein [Bacteroidota bacterium]